MQGWGKGALGPCTGPLQPTSLIPKTPREAPLPPEKVVSSGNHCSPDTGTTGPLGHLKAHTHGLKTSSVYLDHRPSFPMSFPQLLICNPRPSTKYCIWALRSNIKQSPVLSIFSVKHLEDSAVFFTFTHTRAPSAENKTIYEGDQLAHPSQQPC